MARETASNGDLDFEQMMGELAAMKTDLANRQASRRERPAPSRAAADGEPRRTRARRAQTDPRADIILSLEAASPMPSSSSSRTVLSPTSPVFNRSVALAESLRDASDKDKNKTQDQDQNQSRGQGRRPAESKQNSQPGMRLDAVIIDPSSPTESAEYNSLAHTEGRRPPKSAQRTRSISINPSRLSHMPYNDIGGSTGEKGNGPDSQASSPQVIATPPSGPAVAPRQHRPFPSSPAMAAASGQSASVSSSPRLPTRSNSRSIAKSSAPGSSSSFEQVSQGSPTPSVPPRSRSESRPHSRITPGVPEQNSPYIGTPTISESEEYASKQQPAQHMRKKSSSNTLRGLNESGDSVNQSQAPSVLPSNLIQASTDPAAIHRQYQQDPSVPYDHAPDRHPSERRPTRDNGQASGGNSAYIDTRDENRFKNLSGDTKQGAERGRSQRQEGEEAKGGILQWARSRSKSKDASTSRPPEASTYPEYNPALIPSRSASSAGNQRAKSVPRKPSNQNLQGNIDGWPPYSATALNNGQSQTPGGSAHLQHNRSMSKPGNSTASSSNDASTSLNISTNMNKIYHEKMIRGMGMGSTPIVPTVLLTPQPSFPTTASGSAPPGGMRNMALAMMKQEGSPSSSELQMQQRQHQMQHAQMQQQQRLAASAANSTSPPATPTSPKQQMNALQNPSAGTAALTQRLVATRIYIQTETDFKSLNLAPNTTALDVLHMLQQRGTFGEPGDSRYHDRWTVFEYSKEFLIERPLRDFEVLLDIMKTWEAEKDNKMICKSFPARSELSAKEIIRLVGPAGQQGFVRPHGWVHLETKKSRWVKRYLHITDAAVYHSKDSKFNGESMLCLLRNFDVYSVQVPRKKAPTKFGFAMKSSDSIHMYETPEDDYIHYVCVESGELLREWLVGLRAAKGMFMYNANPEVVREGQRHANELMYSATQDGLLSRGDLTEEQPIDQTATPTFHSNLPQEAPFRPATIAKAAAFSTPTLPGPSTALPTTTTETQQSAHTTHSLVSAHSNLDSNHPSSPLSPQAHSSSNFIGLAVSVEASSSSSSLSLSASNIRGPVSINNNDTSANSTGTTIAGTASGLDNMPSNSSDVGTTSSTAVNYGPSLKSPFMAGSLLQQRVQAEKQEIESMKQQLRMREQAGVVGARNLVFMSDSNTPQTNSSSNGNGSSSPGSQNNHQYSGRGRGISASASATSLSSPTSDYSPHQQHQHPLQQPLPLTSQTTAPKFGGPGTLIEKGEARAAELQRSKSAGTGLLRPAHPNTAGGSSGRRTRSKSRGPAEDRVPLGGAASPSSRSPDASPGGGPNVPSVPQGPLLYFEHPDAMIQPGLLLSRAKSAKQASSPSSSPSANSARSPGGGRSKVRQASAGGVLSSGQTLIGQINQIDQRGQSSQSTHGGQSGGGPGGRTRMKPLVDLGNINAGQDGIGPGLLKGNGGSGGGATVSRLARSPSRRQKPLVEF